MEASKPEYRPWKRSFSRDDFSRLMEEAIRKRIESGLPLAVPLRYAPLGAISWGDQDALKHENPSSVLRNSRKYARWFPPCMVHAISNGRPEWILHIDAFSLFRSCLISGWIWGIIELFRSLLISMRAHQVQVKSQSTAQQANISSHHAHNDNLRNCMERSLSEDIASLSYYRRRHGIWRKGKPCWQTIMIKCEL